MSALPLIGVVLDRYRLSRLVADHGTVGTYVADDLGLGRSVRLTAVAAADPDAPALTERRDRIARFAHQHAVNVYDAGSAGGVTYLVHPGVPHPSLADVVRSRRRLDADELLVLAQQIAHALDRAHAAGLEHGQLSAERVVLPRCAAGWFALVDGIGLWGLEALAGRAGAPPTTAVRAGQAAGWPRRDALAPPGAGGWPPPGAGLPAPPERSEAAPDVAALGRLVFFALVGRAMAGAAHPDYAHLGTTTGADRAAQARPDLPPAIDDVLAASQRVDTPVYADCAALVRAVRDVLRGANRHTVVDRD